MQGEQAGHTPAQGSADTPAIGNPGGSIETVLEPSGGRLSATMSAAREHSAQAVSGIQSHVRQAPMQSLVMAMGVGFIIGVLLGSGSMLSSRRR